MKYYNYRDKLETQYALSLVNEDYYQGDILYFTGSKGNNVFTTPAGGIPDPDGTSSPQLYIYNNITTPITSSLTKGFYSGSVDDAGAIDYSKPVYLISRGEYHDTEELGDHVGEVNIGQTRVFLDGALSMSFMLGFDDDKANNPNELQYWANIIPRDWDVGLENRSNDEDQKWNDNYYYPVLPKIDTVTNTFTDVLQSDGGTERKPFGTPNRIWNEDDTIAPVSNLNLNHINLIIDFDMGYLGSENIEDRSGNKNVGVIISDYRLMFDENRRITSLGKTSDIVQDKDKKAY